MPPPDPIAAAAARPAAWICSSGSACAADSCGSGAGPVADDAAEDRLLVADAMEPTVLSGRAPDATLGTALAALAARLTSLALSPGSAMAAWVAGGSDGAGSGAVAGAAAPGGWDCLSWAPAADADGISPDALVPLPSVLTASVGPPSRLLLRLGCSACAAAGCPKNVLVLWVFVALAPAAAAAMSDVSLTDRSAAAAAASSAARRPPATAAAVMATTPTSDCTSGDSEATTCQSVQEPCQLVYARIPQHWPAQLGVMAYTCSVAQSTTMFCTVAE
jgi:hypothetical protein